MTADAPRVAWPTLGVALVCLTGVTATVLATGLGYLPAGVAVAVSTVLCFAGFTPVHEAAHGNVAPWRPLNEATGHACALLVMGALLPYRFIHGQHHRHTNVEALDPDLWGTGSPWSLPLRWVSQDVGYLGFYLARWGQRPRSERANLVGCGAVYVVVAMAAALAGAPWVIAVLAGWFVPARVALVLLAWTFAWLPHAPHDPEPERATTVYSGLPLHVLLLGQSYHGLHHRWPKVPFYRLHHMWQGADPALVAGIMDRRTR